MSNYDSYFNTNTGLSLNEVEIDDLEANIAELQSNIGNVIANVTIIQGEIDDIQANIESNLYWLDGSRSLTGNMNVGLNDIYNICDLHVTCNAYISGNLFVTGNASYVHSNDIYINDPLFFIGNNNTTSDMVDLGWVGTYNSGGVKYGGLFRDQSDGIFKVFTGLSDRPTNTVDTGGTGYTRADLNIGDLNMGEFLDFSPAGGAYENRIYSSGGSLGFYTSGGQIISVFGSDLDTGLSGNLFLTNTDINNVKTLTATTVNATNLGGTSMTGDLNMNSNDINNGATINCVTLDASSIVSQGLNQLCTFSDEYHYLAYNAYQDTLAGVLKYSSTNPYISISGVTDSTDNPNSGSIIIYTAPEGVANSVVSQTARLKINSTNLTLTAVDMDANSNDINNVGTLTATSGVYTDLIVNHADVANYDVIIGHDNQALGGALLITDYGHSAGYGIVMDAQDNSAGRVDIRFNGSSGVQRGYIGTSASDGLTIACDFLIERGAQPNITSLGTMASDLNMGTNDITNCGDINCSTTITQYINQLMTFGGSYHYLAWNGYQSGSFINYTTNSPLVAISGVTDVNPSFVVYTSPSGVAGTNASITARITVSETNLTLNNVDMDANSNDINNVNTLTVTTLNPNDINMQGGDIDMNQGSILDAVNILGDGSNAITLNTNSTQNLILQVNGTNKISCTNTHVDYNCDIDMNGNDIDFGAGAGSWLSGSPFITNGAKFYHTGTTFYLENWNSQKVLTLNTNTSPTLELDYVTTIDGESNNTLTITSGGNQNATLTVGGTGTAFLSGGGSGKAEVTAGYAGSQAVRLKATNSSGTIQLQDSANNVLVEAGNGNGVDLLVPYARFEKTATQSISNNTDTIVTWSSSTTRGVTGSWSETSGVINVPENGIYTISFDCYFEDVSGGVRGCWFESSAFSGKRFGFTLVNEASNATFGTSISGTATIPVDTTDDIELWVYQNSGSSVNIADSSTSWKYMDFTFVKVGKKI